MPESKLRDLSVDFSVKVVKMCEKNIGNKYLTPHKNIKVYVKKGKIFFMA